MKIKRNMLVLIIAATAFFHSCSVINKNEFAQRKYTKFHKGNEMAQVKKVGLNKPQSPEISYIPVIKPYSLHNNQSHSGIVESQKPKASVKLTHNKQLEKNNSLKTENAKKYKPKFPERINKKILHSNRESYSDDQLLLIILAFILPPLAVYLAMGIGNEFWIDLILTLIFWLPGVIYALLVIL